MSRRSWPNASLMHISTVLYAKPLLCTAAANAILFVSYLVFYLRHTHFLATSGDDGKGHMACLGLIFMDLSTLVVGAEMRHFLFLIHCKQ